MAESNEIANIESIDKALTKLDGTINKTADSCLRIVKIGETINKTINDTTQNFENLEKAQKETKKTGDQLDSISKQLLSSEQKLKEIEDTRYQQIVKNRAAIQQKTQAIKDTVKAEGLAETSLVKMRQRLKELTTEYDRSGTRTKAAADEINKLSREIGKAEAATNRHQRGVGGYADQLGNLGNKVSALPGRIGSIGGSISSLASKLGSLGGIGALIAGAVLAIGAPLYTFFTKSEKGIEMLERKTAGFKAAWGVLVGEMIRGGDNIAESFDKSEKKASSFWTKALSIFGSGGTAIGIRMDMASDAANNYTRTLQELEDQERALIVPRAQANFKIKEAMLLYADESKSLEERMSGLRSAIELENQTADVEVEHQKKVVENIRIINKEKQLAGQLRDEDDRKLQEAIARQIELETDSIGRQIRAAKRLQTGRNEILEEQKKKREEENKKQIDAGKETVKALIDQLKEQSDAIKNSLEGNKDEFDKYLDDVMKEVEDQAAKEMDIYLDKEDEKVKKAKESAEKQKEIEKELAEAKWEIGKELGNALFEITGNRIEKELQALELEKNAKLDNDKLTTEQRAQIEAEYTKKSGELKAKQAKQDKMQALFSIAINTAEAIVKALPNIPLSIAMSVLGAIQAGVVLAEPIPKFAKGTKNAPDKGIFAEAGSELMQLTSGKLIYSDKPTYFEGNQFKGATIYTNKETKEIINQTEHSGFSSRTMTDERIVKGLNGVIREIKKIPVPIQDQDHRTIGYKSGNHIEIYLNRITHR